MDIPRKKLIELDFSENCSLEQIFEQFDTIYKSQKEKHEEESLKREHKYLLIEFIFCLSIKFNIKLSGTFNMNSDMEDINTEYKRIQLCILINMLKNKIE